MKKKELIFYMMHDMRSLLFAALNMFFFSLLFLRQQKILKCLVADMFTDFLPVCVCIAGDDGAACCVTVCLILELHFHQTSKFVKNREVI